MALVSILGQIINDSSSCVSSVVSSSYIICHSQFLNLHCQNTQGGAVFISYSSGYLNMSDTTFFNCSSYDGSSTIQSCPVSASLYQINCLRICFSTCAGALIQSMSLAASSSPISRISLFSIMSCGSQQSPGDNNVLQLSGGNFLADTVNSSYNYEAGIGSGLHIELAAGGNITFSTFFCDSGKNLLWLHNTVNGLSFAYDNFCNCSSSSNGLFGFQSNIFVGSSFFLNNNYGGYNPFIQMNTGGTATITGCTFDIVISQTVSIIFQSSIVASSASTWALCNFNTAHCNTFSACKGSSPFTFLAGFYLRQFVLPISFPICLLLA